MTNNSEAAWRLRDARNCLDSARWAFAAGWHRVTAQNAQLCIELSAKAVIAHFAEPAWTHNPSDQLIGVLEQYRRELAEQWGEEMRRAFRQLAADAREAAPWHSLSTYGGRTTERSYIPAVELCTAEVARDLLERAERSFRTASRFLGEVCGESLS